MIELRRLFHRYPEAGFTEFFTTAFIAAYLENLGYTVHMGEDIYEEDRLGVPDPAELATARQRAESLGAGKDYLDKIAGGYTGVIATLQRGNGKKAALRFDIDCVEVGEAEGNTEYNSTIPGRMHACGHDGHTAVGLKVAEAMICDHTWQGELVLVFQPAEEGVRGGRVLSKSRYLNGTDYFCSGHLGITNSRPDTLFTNVAYSLSTSKWDIRVKGEAAHAGNYPEHGKNALLAASDMVMHFYGIPRPSTGVAKLNVGTLNAGTGRNVVADHADMKVETRGETKAINETLSRKLQQVVEQIAALHDVEADCRLAGEAIFAKPAEALVAEAPRYAGDAGLMVNTEPIPMLGSEDAFFFIDRVQREGGDGIYLLFGTEIQAPHHYASFNFNEGILDKMVKYYTLWTLDKLGGGVGETQPGNSRETAGGSL